MVQVVLAGIVLICLGGFTYLLYRARKNERKSPNYQSVVTIESLGELVSQELAEFVRDDDLELTTDSHFEAIHKVKEDLATALDECTYGVKRAKNIVFSHIREILERELPDERDCCSIVDFKDVMLIDSVIQWEILIYMTKKKHRTDTMNYLCDKYDIAEEQMIQNEITDEVQGRYLVNNERLASILEQELDGHEFA